MRKFDQILCEVRRKRLKPLSYYYQILHQVNFFTRFKLDIPYHNHTGTPRYDLSHFSDTLTDSGRLTWIRGRYGNGSDYLVFNLRLNKIIILIYNDDVETPLNDSYTYVCTISLKNFIGDINLNFDNYFKKRHRDL